MRRCAGLAAVASTVVVVAAGGGGVTGIAQATSAKAAGSASFSGAMQNVINTFDPWSGSNGLNGEMQWEGLVYDSLLRVSDKGKLIPDLATSWQVKQQGRQIIMELRKGVKFTDGSTFNASVVKSNILYAQDDTNPGQCDSDLAGMVVDVDGPYKVKLNLTTPNPDILLNMATCASYMVGPSGLKNPTSLTSAPDGSGPYTYDASASVANSSWAFVKNPKNWDAKAFGFAKETWLFYTSQTATDDAAASGQIQYEQVLPSTDTASGLRLFKSPNELFRGLALDDVTGKLVPALGNVLVRQAMNYAINRSAILSSIYNGVGEVDGSSSPFGPGLGPGYTAKLNNMYPYDPTKAKALLAQAGYPNGFALHVLDAPTDVNAELLQAIASYEQAIGINMTVSVVSSGYITTIDSGKAPAFFGQYTLSSAEYQNLVGLATANAFWNPLHNTNPMFNSLLNQLLLATGKKAKGLYQQLATAYSQQAWWIAPVILPNVSGYKPSAVKIAITNGNPCPTSLQIQPA